MWLQSQKTTYNLTRGGEQVTSSPWGWGFQLVAKFRYKLSHALGHSPSGICIPVPFPVPALGPFVKLYYNISDYHFTKKLKSRVRAHRLKHRYVIVRTASLPAG